MGDEADDILSSFHLTEEEMGKYSAVKTAFENHFIKKRNPIFERAKFNQRTQEEGESVDSFVTSLHTLVKHCDYGALQDQMIRDRLVVGIRDAVLSEKLQMEPDLDLEKAVSYARQRETVRKQQSVVRGSSQVKVEAVQTNKQGQAKAQTKKSYTKPFTKPSNVTHGSSKSCTRCGRTPYHSRQSCPARDATCHRCKNKGHFQSQCRTKNVRTVLSEPQDQLDDEFYIATVHGIKSTNAWTATIRVNGVPMEFKIDTGADVSVLPESALQHLKGIQLQPSSKRLTGPNAQALAVRGQFSATCTYKDQHVREEFFVVQDVHTALVGRPVIEALGPVTRIGSIRKGNIQEKYPGIFQGLGTMQGEYHIQLRSGAVPFSQTTPRRVALPMLPKVKEELERMEHQEVISCVDDPTEWCAPMVVVPKADGKVRMCVDLTKLNESVQRERHILPSVEQTLGQLAGGQVFSKLDANSGFWQIPLSKKSSLLTTFITPFGRFCFNRLPFGSIGHDNIIECLIIDAYLLCDC